jgi:thymidylate synthase (FAD)
MGSDLDVVNAARVSFDKESLELTDKDENLIRYLVEHKHDAVFRHCAMSFEIYAPLMVARQWYKHAVGSSHLDDQVGWNESSRRYITEKEQFYIPDAYGWRSTPENKKQGSGGSINELTGAKYTHYMSKISQNGLALYNEALADGVAPEQARMLLPAYSMYVRWRWTASLNALLHFVSLRMDGHAQFEIQEYADIIFQELKDAFPITTTEWLAHRS